MQDGVTSEVTEDGFVVISINIENEIISTELLRQEFINHLESGHRNIIIDTTNITFLNAGTLGVIIGGLKKCKEIDGHIAIVCSNSRMKRTFDITGLKDIFEICDSIDEAIGYLLALTEY